MRVRALAIVALCSAGLLGGCSRPSQKAQGGGMAGAPPNDATLSPAVTSVGDRDRGRLVFTTNCATCHGATGLEGGVGPSLRDERERKNDDATIAWIENPDPPMPKLYPGTLTQSDVVDVAAYVQSL
jgi:mono/diheme cytochrome c family protein